MFFRKEVAITRDVKRCDEIRQRLSAVGIESFVTVNSPTNPGRYHGVPFAKAENSYEYRIYVRRKDGDRACAVLGIK